MREFYVGSKSIKPESIKEQTVVNLCEHGLGYIETTILINHDCLQNGRGTITRSAVHTCKQNMMRMVSNIERCPQGKKSVDSMWARTHHRWIMQLLVQLGLEPDLLDFLNEDGTVPAYFDKGKRVPLRSDGIVWWDKVHKECFIGDYREESMTQTQFPRNPDGTYNPDSKYRDKKQLLTVKYPKQGRFCL